MITSKDNPQVKALKRWLSAPKRGDERMVVEGIHAGQLLLSNARGLSLHIERVWVGQAALDHFEIIQLVQQAQVHSIPVLTLSSAIFRELSSLEQGVSIFFEVQRPQVLGISKEVVLANENYILLDGVQDPGNLGSIIRSAAACGIQHIWLSEQCANPYSPKVLRAGVGAHFGVQIREKVDLHVATALLKEKNVQICATSSHTQKTIYAHDLNSACAWLLGNEGAGLSEVLMQQADVQLTIPMQMGESLNVAAAAAVCLFEMRRQQG